MVINVCKHGARYTWVRLSHVLADCYVKTNTDTRTKPKTSLAWLFCWQVWVRSDVRQLEGDRPAPGLLVRLHVPRHVWEGRLVPSDHQLQHLRLRPPRRATRVARRLTRVVSCLPYRSPRNRRRTLQTDSANPFGDLTICYIICAVYMLNWRRSQTNKSVMEM